MEEPLERAFENFTKVKCLLDHVGSYRCISFGVMMGDGVAVMTEVELMCEGDHLAYQCLNVVKPRKELLDGVDYPFD